MVVIIDIFFGILIVVGASISLWAFIWMLKLLGMAFRYILPSSGIIKIRSWVIKLDDILLLLILLLILAIVLFALFRIGQSFTGNP